MWIQGAIGVESVSGFSFVISIGIVDLSRRGSPVFVCAYRAWLYDGMEVLGRTASAGNLGETIVRSEV